MTISRRSAALGVAALVAVTALQAGSASAHGRGEGSSDDHGRAPYTFAVIGDIPYGDAQIARFPGVVAQINADPAVQLVAHLGDIKSGSTVCSDEYFSWVKQQFDAFADPLVYTVGDNEWTDCHRPNNGGYNPLERLAAIRSVFFAHPGYTLGQHPAEVTSQAAIGVPENVRFTRARVAFAAVDVVGSNDGLLPWTGNTAPTAEQTAEVLSRTSAVIAEIRDTFAQAKAERDRGVVLMMQADMFDPTVTDPSYDQWYGFTPIVQAIAQESAAFDGPVYLFNGDSHVYHHDAPLAAGSSWLSFYGVTAPVTNLTRVTIDGSTHVSDYLRVTVNPRGPVLTWDRVPFTS